MTDILLAKIKGIFKRRYQRSLLSATVVTLNPADRTAEIDGKPVELAAKEFDLLALLIENQGKTLKKEYLFSCIWAAKVIRSCKRCMYISTVCGRSLVMIRSMRSAC